MLDTNQPDEPTSLVAELGHVGLFTNDWEAQIEFYSNVIGLIVTDIDERAGMAFLSARPDQEHHELLLAQGRTVDTDTEVLILQQVSFRCRTLRGLKTLYSRLRHQQCQIDMVVSHGNAIGVYFRDPEGNRVEVYWQTGLHARQPFLQAINLDNTDAEILAEVERIVGEYGETGYIDEDLLSLQEVNTS